MGRTVYLIAAASPTDNSDFIATLHLFSLDLTAARVGIASHPGRCEMNPGRRRSETRERPLSDPPYRPQAARFFRGHRVCIEDDLRPPPQLGYAADVLGGGQRHWIAAGLSFLVGWWFDVAAPERLLSRVAENLPQHSPGSHLRCHRARSVAKSWPWPRPPRRCRLLRAHRRRDRIAHDRRLHRAARH